MVHYYNTIGLALKIIYYKIANYSVHTLKADYDVSSVPCFVKIIAEADLLMKNIQPITLHPKGYFFT